MATVTPNDVRALAVSGLDSPILALVEGEVALLSATEAPEGAQVIITREHLNEELGDEVTDVEADLLAGRLTALLTTTP
jgi:hypothetical protein